jgi:predicted proteasome-type protease
MVIDATGNVSTEHNAVRGTLDDVIHPDARDHIITVFNIYPMHVAFSPATHRGSISVDRPTSNQMSGNFNFNALV